MNDVTAVKLFIGRKMKINMAEADYYSVGMIVSCTTCHGKTIQGEVMAFDYSTRMLALKSASESGNRGAHDVRFINLSLVSKVDVIKEAPSEPPQLPVLHLPKLSQRLRQNVEEKHKLANSIGVNVSPEAQKLFHTIHKTITEVRWDNQNIVVMDQVTIYPPYCSENCKGKDGNQALQHVRKIVEKFHSENESDSQHTKNQGS